jgi:N-methylhydantoinase A
MNRTNTTDSSRNGIRDLTIGVDIGGTFTDCIVAFDDGRIIGGKSPTTPHDRSLGFFSAIDRVAEKLSLPVATLMARCRRLVHGTTTGTNAIVSRDGAEVGLLTTTGHGDALFMMRGSGRTAGLPADELLNISETYKPRPLIPRHRVREICERCDADGDEIVALDEAAVVAAALELAADGVEAIAISFLWSVKNPAHEQRAVELVREALPELFVTCGSSLVGTMGEYERTTTTVMNAYIGPLMLRYISAIETGARRRGYEREVLFAQCGGGAITGNEARQAPIRTVQSGPVAGIIASERLAARIGEPNVLAADMGGTTFDVSVIREGEPLERSTSLFQRLELALPMFDVESIGAGGGSIAWIDESGRLNVGPKSAGADPGPACYGKGEQATTTDADVVLGLIDPEKFLGGRMPIDPERSVAAIRRIGENLGLGLHETAAGISRIVDAKMADLIRRMSVMRGFDPRQFCCFAFGGGGPVHAAAVAREAGVARVIVPLPVNAALWSAVGAATADVVHVLQSPQTFEEPFDIGKLQAEFRQMEVRALQQLHSEGFDSHRIALTRRVRMKYAMQVHDVEVPIDPADLARTDPNELILRFGEIYENLFGAGSGFREGGVEITGLQLRARGETEKIEFAALENTVLPESSVTEREIYWGETEQLTPTPVWEIDYGQSIPPIDGPALVQLPDSVVVIRPGQKAEMDALGNIIIHIL